MVGEQKIEVPISLAVPSRSINEGSASYISLVGQGHAGSFCSFFGCSRATYLSVVGYNNNNNNNTMRGISCQIMRNSLDT